VHAVQGSTGGQKSELSKSQKAEDKIWIIDTFPYNGEMVVELRLKHLYRWLSNSSLGPHSMEHFMWQDDIVAVINRVCAGRTLPMAHPLGVHYLISLMLAGRNVFRSDLICLAGM